MDFSKLKAMFRKTSTKINATKHGKLGDELNEDQNETAVAGPSNNQSASPPIFKLTVDCCDEIFEYLSMKDLHSLGATCKAMQKAAGEYFKRNCAEAEKFTNSNGISTCYYEGESYKQTSTSAFNRYVTNISYYYEDLGPLDFIESHSHELDSVRGIYLVCTHIDAPKVKYFQKILPKIESVSLHQCTGDGDIFNTLLQFCKSMTNLWIQDDLGYIVSRRANPWLLQSYPTLKSLHLSPRHVNEINELATFFERNRNVEKFSTNYRCLWANGEHLMNSTATLKTLCAEDFQYDTIGNMDEICELLKRLHANGFYKRLHLNFREINRQLCDELVSVPALEKLHFEKFTGIYSVPRMIGLKELCLPGGLDARDIEILATNLVHLEQVTISAVSSNDLMPFMRHSKTLKKLHAYLNERTLNLPKLNKEREKLADARKVTIFVTDNIFLATKWTTHHGEINRKFIEMRPINSA